MAKVRQALKASQRRMGDLGRLAICVAAPRLTGTPGHRVPTGFRKAMHSQPRTRVQTQPYRVRRVLVRFAESFDGQSEEHHGEEARDADARCV